MTVHMTLLGGPPWGLRLTSDQELRPVVSKILMGGRASRAGVKAGDVLLSVNSMPVFTCKQAHAFIQKAQGQLRLAVIRSGAADSTPASRYRDTFKSSSMASAPHGHAMYGGVRSVRLDIEAASGSTKQKRRFFEEQIAKSNVMDRLLQRKIQLGMTHNGAPSESTAGYDSVEADFAGGGRSNTESSRTSPSLVAVEELDEVTIAENSRETVTRPPMATPVENGPGNVTSPAVRQSVADLRRQFTSSLEMKAPGSSPRCASRAEVNCSPVPSREFRHSFVKVHETGDDFESRKPWLGRVLDGPVPPEKYYQGVMPPSAIQSLSPVPAPDAKPPSPMPKPSWKQYSRRNSFLNRLAGDHIENHVPAPGPTIRPATIAPIARISSSLNERHDNLPTAEPTLPQCNQPSSSQKELPPVTPPPYRTAPFTEKSFSTVFQMPTGGSDRGDTMEDKKPSKKDGLLSMETIEKRMPDPLKSRSPAPFSCSSSPNAEVKPMATLQNLNDALAAFSKAPPAPSNNLTVDSGYESSAVLVSSELQQKQEQQSYSKHELDDIWRSQEQQSNSELRSDGNKHSQVVLPEQQQKRQQTYENSWSGQALSHDSQKEQEPQTHVERNVAGSWQPLAALPEKQQKQEQQPFVEPKGDANWHSQAAPTEDARSMTPSDPEVRDEAPHTRALQQVPALSATPLTVVPAEPTSYDRSRAGDGTISSPPQQHQHTPEMSLWYRNMFKKMHKLESPGENSVLRHRIREDSPAPTISRPLTPLSFTVQPPSRHECEVTPRRAKSVGRIVEPEMLDKDE